MRDIIEPLTLEQLIDLAHKVKGIVCGVPWAQGEVGEDYDSILRGDVTALVIDDETGEVILDCGEHDHGPEIVAAIVAMRNSFPVLFNMARDYAKRRAETFEALELLAQAVQDRNQARANARILANAYSHDTRPPQSTVSESLAYPIAEETSHAS